MKDEIPRLDVVLPTLLIWALGRQKQVGLCELEDNLIYIVSSRSNVAEPWLHCEAVSFKRRGGGGEDQDEKKEEEGRRRRKEEEKIIIMSGSL